MLGRKVAGSNVNTPVSESVSVSRHQLCIQWCSFREQWRIMNMGHASVELNGVHMPARDSQFVDLEPGMTRLDISNPSRGGGVKKDVVVLDIS